MAKKKRVKKSNSTTPAPKSKKARVRKTKSPILSMLETAPESKAFHVADGQILRDLRELAFALESMNDDIFYHHANHERNDFSSWVEGVFKDKDLATALRTVNNKLHAQITVLHHLVRKL